MFIVGTPRQVRPDIELHEFGADTTWRRLEAITRLVGEGRLAPDVAVELPLRRAREALEHAADPARRGRAVVRCAVDGAPGRAGVDRHDQRDRASRAGLPIVREPARAS